MYDIIYISILIKNLRYQIHLHPLYYILITAIYLVSNVYQQVHLTQKILDLTHSN